MEFGRLAVIDEVEGGIVRRFAVLADKTGEQGQLVPALAHYRQLFGKAPDSWRGIGDCTRQRTRQ